MKCIIGSKSERKIETVKKVLEQIFSNKTPIKVLGFATDSKVPDTPYDIETFNGARNRALGSKSHGADADVYIGLESGLIERYGHIYEEAWAVVLTGNGSEYYGYSSGLKVPDYILSRMDELKIEHCDVMGIIEEEFGKTPNDTWGTYSGGAILRTVSLEEALRNALIQYLAPKESFYGK